MEDPMGIEELLEMPADGWSEGGEVRRHIDDQTYGWTDAIDRRDAQIRGLIRIVRAGMMECDKETALLDVKRRSAVTTVGKIAIDSAKLAIGRIRGAMTRAAEEVDRG